MIRFLQTTLFVEAARRTGLGDYWIFVSDYLSFAEVQVFGSR